jgi:hypothetical protein
VTTKEIKPRRSHLVPHHGDEVGLLVLVLDVHLKVDEQAVAGDAVQDLVVDAVVLQVLNRGHELEHLVACRCGEWTVASTTIGLHASMSHSRPHPHTIPASTLPMVKLL